MHGFPECISAGVGEAVALIRIGPYRDRVAERYALDGQQQVVPRFLADLT
jgi:hypothetical protein